MTEKTTPWFPASVKPVRRGLYQVQHKYWDETPYSYWDGERFNAVYIDRREAFAERSFAGCGPEITEWRGLAEQPQ